MYVCLFDIDGTLLSSGGAGKAAMEQAITSRFGARASTDSVPFSGRTDRMIAKDLFALHGIEDSKQNWEGFRDEYLRHLPRCLCSHVGKILPGIAQLLEDLRGREDVVIGLLTGNIRAGAMLKLEHYGIYHYFAFGSYGDDHLDRDEVAREALAITNKHLHGVADPDRVWVIGDSPLDVRCARAIGVRVAAVATGLHTVKELEAFQPDLVLENLSNAAQWMELWA